VKMLASKEPTHELTLTNGNIIDVSSKRIYKGDIVTKDGRIARIDSPGASVKGKNVIDASGKYISPGLIDSHLHIESSMLSPIEFSKEAVRHGTTTIFVDPHEIANVCGRKGIELFLNQSDLVPLDMFVGIPSCVPSTELEDSGGNITLEDIRELVKDPRVYGLAEMMNFPGIVRGSGNAREKVDVVYDFGKVVDGHCPGLTSDDLRTYVSNGKNDGVVRIMSDHEATTASEALEKHKAGMYIALRYGSATKDLNRILPTLVCKRNVKFDRFMLCSDDLDPIELYEEGHVDRIIKRARDIVLERTNSSLEQATVFALSLATVNPAMYFSRFFELDCHAAIGQIETGKKANLVVFDSLEDLVVETVLHNGRLVVDKGVYIGDDVSYDYSEFLRSVNVGREVSASDFKVRYSGNERTPSIKVIGVIEGSLETELIELPMEVYKGEIKADAEHVAKVAVIERHKQTGSYSLGFVKGLGIRRGAVASTVAHDSHNLIVVGVDDECMAKASNYLSAKGGGMVVVTNSEISYFPLKIGGLMSTSRIEKVVDGYKKTIRSLEAVGCSKENMFMTMSFLSLPVIPRLRITNRGLVAVDEFAFVELFGDARRHCL
jgi:adenine deaminase